jgi:hypothetical protein
MTSWPGRAPSLVRKRFHTPGPASLTAFRQESTGGTMQSKLIWQPKLTLRIPRSATPALGQPDMIGNHGTKFQAEGTELYER